MKLKSFLFIAIAAFSAFNLTSVQGAPGELDPTFNGTGKLDSGITFTTAWAAPRTMVIQPDGKILAAGYISDGPRSRSVIVRYNVNGSVDTSFGTGGAAELVYSDHVTAAGFEMKLQPDGKIVLAIAAIGEFGCGATRLNANGSIDQGFGRLGRATIDTQGTSCLGVGVAIQNDGGIVVLGQIVQNPSGSDSVALMRFDQNGAPDTNFDGDGLRFSGTGLSSDPVRTVLSQPDGKILVVGETRAHGSDHLIYRFNQNGSDNLSFGTGGRSVIGTGDEEGNYTALLQPDGKIVIAGSANWVPAVTVQAFEMIRVNTDGSLDGGFGNGGYVRTLQSERQVRFASAVALQPDGKILLGGGFYYYSATPGLYQYDYAVARYSANGVLESSDTRGKFFRGESVLSSVWGDNGISHVRIAGADTRVLDMKIDAAGRVVAYGAKAGNNTGYMVMARFQGDASPYASLSGAIKTAGGMPIKNISVVLSGGGLSQPVYALTNQFGYYTFANLPVTETYTVSISSKRFNFGDPAQSLMLNQDTANVDFTAE